MLTEVFARNRAGSAAKNAEVPGYSARLATRHTPDFFWIGCSDSRVPANVVAGRDAGAVFVHRNVANLVHPTDMIFLSTPEFAVAALSIRQIILCGHDGCGGVKAATRAPCHCPANRRLEPIRRRDRMRADERDRRGTLTARRDRLAELNVIEGVRRLAETPILRRARARGLDVAEHGLIHAIGDGLLRDLGCAIRAPDPVSVR